MDSEPFVPLFRPSLISCSIGSSSGTSTAQSTPCHSMGQPLAEGKLAGEDLADQSAALLSNPSSARTGVPKLKFPVMEAEPFVPLFRPSLMSSIGSSSGTSTAESTPCHSMDQPLVGRDLEAILEAIPRETVDKSWLGRPSLESCFSDIHQLSNKDLLGSSPNRLASEDLPDASPAQHVKPASARSDVPKLQLPMSDGMPFEPLIRPSMLSSIGSDSGTSTVESTPCHSMDQPLVGWALEAIPRETVDKSWLGRPSLESCFSDIHQLGDKDRLGSSPNRLASEDLPDASPALPSKPASARSDVPKLQLPMSDGVPFEPLIRPSMLSSIGSDSGTSTVESTPCHSMDQPFVGRASGAAPPAAVDGILSGRTSVESCISHIRDRSYQSEASTRRPSSALSSAEIQEAARCSEMLRKYQDENRKLRAALNTEKQRVLDLKLADQQRRSVWSRELQQLEVELADKRSLEISCTRLSAEVDRLRTERSAVSQPVDPAGAEAPASSARSRLHQVLSLFVVHVCGPLSAIRDACAEMSAGAACPQCPAPVAAGAADGEYVDRLMRVLEILRFYQNARSSPKVRPASVADVQPIVTESASARTSLESTPPQRDSLSHSVRSVLSAASGGKVLQTLDNTVEDISDWFLGEFERGMRGDGYNEVVPKDHDRCQ